MQTGPGNLFFPDTTNSAARASHALYRTSTLALWEMWLEARNKYSKDGPVPHMSFCLTSYSHSSWNEETLLFLPTFYR